MKRAPRGTRARAWSIARLLALAALGACSDLKVIDSPDSADAAVQGSAGDGQAGAAAGATSRAGSGAGGSAGGAGGSAGGSTAGNTAGTAASAGGESGMAGSEAGSAGSGTAGTAGTAVAAGTGGTDGDAGSAPACPPGTEGCACDSSGGCVTGLACVGALCTSAFCGNGQKDGAEQCDDGNAVDTDACTPDCMSARCGDGLVRADSEECDDANATDGDSCTNACKKRYNIAFVTSTTYTVLAMGGVAGADAACQARASAGGFSGNFIAWISSSTSELGTRLAGARGWVRPDGKPFLDEYDGPATYYPPRVTELKTEVTDGVTPALGNYSQGTGGGSCDDWTSTGSGKWFLRGDPTDGTGGWSGSWRTVSCSGSFRLYCLQKDFKNPLTFAKVEGRLAFVTNDRWVPAGGLTAADARCNQDASAAGLPGTFKALLATTGASAASRFTTAGGPWVRRDGIPLVAQAADMFVASGVLVAPLNVTASGNYLGNNGGWSGGADPKQPGTNTCSNWTSADASLTTVGGRALCGHISEMLANDPMIGCDKGYRLYCLQTP